MNLSFFTYQKKLVWQEKTNEWMDGWIHIRIVHIHLLFFFCLEGIVNVQRFQCSIARKIHWFKGRWINRFIHIFQTGTVILHFLFQHFSFFWKWTFFFFHFIYTQKEFDCWCWEIHIELIKIFFDFFFCCNEKIR